MNPNGNYIFSGGRIFNGTELLVGHRAVFANGIWINTVADCGQSIDGELVNLDNDILSVGYADLQVNGGGGIMLNNAPTVDSLETIARAHRALGTTTFLPTLITDTPQVTQNAIAATKSAIRNGVQGVAGIHLEGPHIAMSQRGAHDEHLIREMGSDDLRFILNAALDLPVLKVTVAPENVTCDQVRALVNGGVVVALGHTDASYDTCRRYMKAGASCTTHLFNAMSQLKVRDPGLVGASIESEACYIGLIADGIHVHPSTLRTAWRAKPDTKKMFLVSDAMAVAGTELNSFVLNGRTVHRRRGCLRLSNLVLAGADLEITKAVKEMYESVGIELAEALYSAVSAPREILRGCNFEQADFTISDMIRINPDLSSASPLVS